MRTVPLLLAALLVLLPARAAEDPESRGLPRRLAAEALRDGLTYRLLSELCETAPHRLAGSPGAERAVAWGKETMERVGLENVRLEPCRVPHWERGKVEELTLLAEGIEERLRILAIGGSVATPPAGLEAEVVEVRDFAELKTMAPAAKGKIVFFNGPMDPSLLDPMQAYGRAAGQRTRGAAEAAKVGAIAVVVRSLTTRIDDSPHTGTLFYDRGGVRIPAACVSTRGAERIAKLIDDGEEVRLRLRLACEWHEDADSHNVIGELRGREKPEEIVLVGGHLDAWDVGQGAHDDGAGCCQSIASLALLKRLDLRPRRTLRVVLFMNEENGTRGGKAYAKAHAKDLESHVFALESDRGGFAPRGFKTNANPAALEILRGIADPMRPIGIGFVVPGGGGVDIGPMGPSGVVLAGYVPDSQRYFDVHHSERDTIDSVNERELELGTAAIAALIHAVAEREDPLPRNPKRE